MSANKDIFTQSTFDRGVSPVWAELLYKGVQKRDKLSDAAEQVKGDPSLLFKGMLGKSLLDRHINPFLEKMLPDSVKLDVLKQNLLYSPTKKLGFSFGKKGDTSSLGINYRF
tara:strand:- start:6443 stop:6778 length:336 start_codon:yes stop_codon:yes gene_type:complete